MEPELKTGFSDQRPRLPLPHSVFISSSSSLTPFHSSTLRPFRLPRFHSSLASLRLDATSFETPPPVASAKSVVAGLAGPPDVTPPSNPDCAQDEQETAT
ncbi:hypothetical protein L2E82_26923 [Cichorium intybus]|uniref:Uncharacterized protein n=1 Tax=Cichorium intybus TaxID=13427 RepID=A0ACB9CRJ2_CICIN|nr:hypothetical protein L2E82_26923 [Cichorium intybus]